MNPTVIRAAEGQRTAWRNGGGETVEIAIFPPGAAIDAFAWRISRAGVVVDGPFSDFPGIDRTLLVLTGVALTLTVAGQAPVRLDCTSAPFSFAGDSPVTGALVDGPITDLNVMTRRGRFSNTVERLALDAPMIVAPGEGTCVVVCCAGRLADGDVSLDPGDALVLAGPCHVAPQGGAAVVAVIRISAERGLPA